MIRRKPYDAEIEYLESTGTQWIDTGLLGRDGYDFEYRFRPLNPLPCGIGGEYQGNKNCYIGLVRSNGNLAYNYYTPNDIVEVQSLTLGMDYNVKAHLHSGEQYFEVNGVRGGIGRRTGNFVSDFSLYVFAVNNNNQLFANANLMLYSLKIYLNGVLVRDFIPVRVGSVGYMYDRVSGQLFGNAGTGAFVLGPDVSDGESVMRLHNYQKPPSAQDYIQDGLIAMWDGIENAVWGVHNPNATVWADLTGNGHNATLTEYGSFGARELLCDGSNCAALADVTNLPTLGQIEFAYNRTYTSYGYFARFGGYSVAFKGTGVAFGRGNTGQTRTEPFYECPLKASVSMEYSTRNVYINTILQTTGSGTELWDKLREGEIGGRYDRTVNVYKGGIYSIRLYSRALTAEEIAYNYAVDKERFGL